MSLKPNIGTWDRVMRIGLALVILALYFLNVLSGAAAIILGVVALVFVLTSSVNFCPLYVPFRFSTRRGR